MSRRPCKCSGSLRPSRIDDVVFLNEDLFFSNHVVCEEAFKDI